MNTLKAGVSLPRYSFLPLSPQVRYPNGILSHHSSSKAKSPFWPLSMTVILHLLTYLALLLAQSSSALPTGCTVLVKWFSALNDSYV